MSEVKIKIEKTGYKLQKKHITFLDEYFDDDLIRTSAAFREHFKLAGNVSDDLIQQYNNL